MIALGPRKCHALTTLVIDWRGWPWKITAARNTSVLAAPGCQWTA